MTKANNEKVIKFPKKMKDGIVKLGDEEIELNFGLQFACDVDNYREDVAMIQGIDNIIIVATSLIKRKLDALKDLMSFALKGSTDEPEVLAMEILEEYAEKGELEVLYNLFFTNVLANKFLKEQVEMNRTLLNHIMNMATLEMKAKEMQMQEILQEMEKEMEVAEKMQQEMNQK